MALRPELEARVREVEEQASEASIRVDQLCDTLDELTDSSDGAIDDEILENSSVVRHRIDLQRTTRTARRETNQMAAAVSSAVIKLRR